VKAIVDCFREGVEPMALISVMLLFSGIEVPPMVFRRNDLRRPGETPPGNERLLFLESVWTAGWWLKTDEAAVSKSSS
jgi:hypothetical protein